MLSRFPHERMEVLIGRYLEQTLGEDEAAELLEFLRENPQWNEEFLQQLLSEVELRNYAKFLEEAPEEWNTMFFRERPEFPDHKPRDVPSRHFPRLPSVFAASVLVMLCFFFYAKSLETRDSSVAVLVKTTNCLWNDSTTQTSPGTRLGRCRLRLEHGIALLRFDCGVEVSLEGPSDFEIVDEKQALLHSGRLVASIESEQGKGFVISTRETKITDLGTKFGVFAPKDHPTEVYVIEGLVEVSSKTFIRPISLSTGESILDGVEGPSPNSPLSRGNGSEKTKNIQISTTNGRGCEASVISDPSVLNETNKVFPQGMYESYMFVKNSVADDEKSNRKAIFRIDLDSLSRGEIRSVLHVGLDVSYGPTEMGYASNVPDSIFTLYGLIDGDSDFWDAQTICWETFPGNAPHNALLSTCWTPLGTFQIKQGSRFGILRIENDALKEFVQKDSNGLLTFAVVRDTRGQEKYGLVHGFANRNHPTLMPPRLILQLPGEDAEIE